VWKTLGPKERLVRHSSEHGVLFLITVSSVRWLIGQLPFVTVSLVPNTKNIKARRRTYNGAAPAGEIKTSHSLWKQLNLENLRLLVSALQSVMMQQKRTPSWSSSVDLQFSKLLTHCIELELPPWAIGDIKKYLDDLHKTVLESHHNDYDCYEKFGITKSKSGTHWLDINNILFTGARNALRAKRSMNVLFSYLLERHPRFHDKDQGSNSWLKTWHNFMRKYLVLWVFGLATKWLKYQIAAAFAKAAEQELPAPLEGEKPGAFLSGIGYVFLRHLMQGQVPHSRASCYSILMCKKGLPQVHPMELYQGKLDCFNVLTGPDRRERLYRTTPPQLCREGVDGEGSESVGPEGLHDARRVNKSPFLSYQPGAFAKVASYIAEEKVLPTLAQYKDYEYTKRLFLLGEEVVRTAEELFSNKAPWENKHEKLVPTFGSLGVPSTKSHFESDRQSGGAYGYVHELWKHCLDATCRSHTGGRRYPEMAYRVEPQGFFDEKSDSVAQFQERETASRCDIIVVDDHNESIEHDKVYLSKAVQNFWAACLDLALKTPNDVSAVALPEPLKVRVITRGPAIRYYVGKVLQSLTWRVLSQHVTFKPIGAPITESYLSGVVGVLGQGEAYLSGDYKSATDLLHPDLSALAVVTIAERLCLSEDITRLYLDGLVDSRVKCPRSGQMFPQRWGQLMGSPLSFPILCLVNAAVNRYFLEMSCGKILKLEDCPMTINGDDIVMRVQERDYGMWKMVVDDAGLVPSIGKNYLSRTFIVINSTFYEVRDTVTGRLFDEPSSLGSPVLLKLPYLNLALVCPTLERSVDYSTGVSLDPKLKDIGQISHEATRGFDLITQDRIMSYLVGWADVKWHLARVPPGVSWFVDKRLGGLGLKYTRSGLLSPEQLGYYTRVAGIFGSGSLLYDQTVSLGGGPGWCLLDTIPSKVCWRGWFEPDLVEKLPQPNVVQLMKAYAADTSPGKINSRIEERKFLSLDFIDDDLFRRHKAPYGEQILCNFPWAFCEVRDYGHSDQAMVCVN
jgi:hypothetical protein